MNPILINESQLISEKLVRKFNIQNFCCFINENEYKVEFVGFVYNKENLLVSFPKKSTNKNLKNLGCLLKKYLNSNGPKFIDEIENNFPLKSYTEIIKYYKKYGLYFKQNINYIKGYSGNIDWKRTINKSNMIINNSNILYNPFIIKNYKNMNNLITESMKWVLNDGYNKFGKYFNIGIKEKFNAKINENFSVSTIINELKKLKSNNFNDKILFLINNLIEYFIWKSKIHKNSKFITTKFSYLWESMVEKYLNNNLLKITNKYEMIFSKNKRKYMFHKKIFLIENKKNSHAIEIDHFFKNENVIIILDSKYYSYFKNLDYKQISYHYFVKNKYPQYNDIYNALIIPTNKSNYYRIHLDRKSIDDVVILEYYLNIDSIIKFYLE